MWVARRFALPAVRSVAPATRRLLHAAPLLSRRSATPRVVLHPLRLSAATATATARCDGTRRALSTGSAKPDSATTATQPPAQAAGEPAARNASDSSTAAPSAAAPSASATASAATPTGSAAGGERASGGSDSDTPPPLPRITWVLLALMGVSGGYALSLVLYFPEPCTVALSAAERDERIARAFGTPLRARWPWRWAGDSGTGHLTEHAGYAAISIPFSAPRGFGEITARLVFNPDTQRWDRMTEIVSGIAVPAADDTTASAEQRVNGAQFYVELPPDTTLAVPRPPPALSPDARPLVHPHYNTPQQLRAPAGSAAAPLAREGNPAMADSWVAAHEAVVKAHGAAIVHAPAAATAATAPAAPPANKP